MVNNMSSNPPSLLVTVLESFGCRFPGSLFRSLRLRRAFGVLAFLLGGMQAQHAATLIATSPSQVDVAAAVAAASDGDTVFIPAGTATWTTQLFIIEKAITVRGAGTNDTVIIDEIPSRAPAISIRFTKPTGLFRLTGIQIKGGEIARSENNTGTIRMQGSNLEFGNSKWRIDHCFFNRQRGRPIGVYAWSGLIDNCTFDQNGAGGMLFDGRVPDTENKGHRSWATPVRWGTVDAGVYVESCYVTNIIVRAIIDGFTGARYVFRDNVCVNVAAENHGTESTGVFRSTRAMEVYRNRFHATTSGENAVLLRGGTALVFNNHVTGSFPGLLRMANFRDRDPYPPYGMANGLNPWDLNDPVLYGTGAHDGTADSALLVVSTAAWVPNQWRGYHFINMRTGKSGQVQSNTGTTVTFFSPIFPGNRVLWTAGDAFEIRKVIRALDGVGQGMGDFLVGGSNTPSVPPTPVGWPHQADEPVHVWDNTGITGISDSGMYTIVAGRTYVTTPLAGYTPLSFPHPYAIGSTTPPSAPLNLRVVP